MEVDPNLAWDGMWKKVSHRSYPSTVFESCTRVPHPKGQYIEETVLEICSGDELDSEYTESINPQPISSKQETLNDISDKQPPSTSYCVYTTNSDAIRSSLEHQDEDDKVEIIEDLQPTSANSENVKRTDVILVPSPVYINHENLEETSDYLHPSDKESEVVVGESASSAIDHKTSSCQKGKLFRNGAQRRSNTLPQTEDYVSCNLCQRLFRGTRARNIHTNKAHAVVTSKRRQKMMNKIPPPVTGTDGNAVEKSTEKCGTASVSNETCSPLIRKRSHISSLEPPESHDPQTKQHREESLRMTSEFPHLAPAYTISSAPDESNSVMNKIPPTVTGTDGNAVEESTEKCGTASVSNETCSPLIRKRSHTSSLEPPESHDPQTKQHREESLRMTSEFPHLAPAYTISSAPDESNSVDSTRRRYHKTCLASASCSHQSPVSTSSSLCPGSRCTLNSPDQVSPPWEYKVDQTFVDKRSRSNRDRTLSDTTTTQSTLCLATEETAIDEAPLAELDVSGHSRAGSATESLPSVTLEGGKQKLRQLDKPPASTTVKTNDGSYQCRICNRIYTNRFSLTGHYKAHYDILHKPHTCDECSQRFTSQSNLKYHQLRNCPVLRIKALTNGAWPPDGLQPNTSLIWAKAKRAIARKAGLVHSPRVSSTASDAESSCGTAPLPNALSIVRCAAPKQIRRKKPSDDHMETPLPDDAPQSPPVVLTTSETLQAVDKKQYEVPPNTSCAADSYSQQPGQRQVSSSSYVMENQSTLTDALLPCVKRIIDQAYDSEELRNKIVTLTSAAILSLISQAIPQASDYGGVPQDTQKKPALPPSLSVNHVLQVMADNMLRNQRVAPPSSSGLCDSTITNTETPDRVKRNEFQKHTSFSDSSPQEYPCPNAPPYYPSRNKDLHIQNVVDHLFSQAASGSSSPNASMRRPFSPTVQTGAPPDPNRSISSPYTILPPEYAADFTTPQNKAGQLKAVDRPAAAVVHSKTCPICGRTFVSLSACRSHHTKVHVGSQHKKQLTNQLIQK